MRLWRYGALFLSVLIFWGCSTSGTQGEDDNMSSRNITAYQILKSGLYPQIEGIMEKEEAGYSLFHSDNPEEVAAFEKLYRELTAEAPPRFNGTVLVAFARTFPHGGYSYVLQALSQKRDRIEVQLHVDEPAPQSLVTMALTKPYLVLLFPDSFKEVYVEEV